MGAMRQSHIERGLQNKGFALCNKGHRRFVYWSESGKKTTVRTMTSHGADKAISAGLVAKMAGQCKLCTSDFERLVNCPLLRHEYENMLRIQGIHLD